MSYGSRFKSWLYHYGKSKRITVPIFLEKAMNELGICEIPGLKANARILEYIETVTYSHDMKYDEIAWCAALFGFVMVQCGRPHTGSLLAKSYMSYGRTLATPRLGCGVIFDRGDKAWQGHIGFFLDEYSGLTIIVGGNQGDRVGVNAYLKSKVRRYFWPDLTLPQ